MVQSTRETSPPAGQLAGWRVKIGFALFGLSIALPLIGVPLVAALDLAAATAIKLSGATLAVSEILGIIAAAIMGKSGYVYIKSRLFAFFRLFRPAGKVGRARYRIGLAMFIVPFLFAWISPYVAGLLPGYRGNEFSYAVVADVLLLASLFVLGGDFWDKLRALFIHGAKAVFPIMAD